VSDGAGGVMARLFWAEILLCCIVLGVLIGWGLVSLSDPGKDARLECNVDCKPFAGEMHDGWCYCDENMKMPEAHQ